MSEPISMKDLTKLAREVYGKDAECGALYHTRGVALGTKYGVPPQAAMNIRLGGVDDSKRVMRPLLLLEKLRTSPSFGSLLEVLAQVRGVCAKPNEHERAADDLAAVDMLIEMLGEVPGV